MLGTFQQSQLRIELDAPRSAIAQALLEPATWPQWQAPQRFSAGLPERLEPGLVFTGWIGPVAIARRVDWVSDAGVCLLLSGGIDGYHEWRWGDGWVQSRLEGISLLPLRLGQTAALLSLRQWLAAQNPRDRRR